MATAASISPGNAIATTLSPVDASSSPPVTADDRQAQVMAGFQVVCICRAIRRKTLEQAIKNGARSFADIRRKTGAMTGQCGATRCTGPIEALLATVGVTPAAAASGGASAQPGRPSGNFGPRSGTGSGYPKPRR